MNKREYQKLLGLAEQQKREAIERANKEYQDRLATLNWAFQGGKADLSDAAQRAANDPSSRVIKGEIEKAILGALSQLGATFNHRDVENVLANRGIKRSSLSSALRRLAQDRTHLKVAEQGKGKRATVYAKTSGEVTSDENVTME